LIIPKPSANFEETSERLLSKINFVYSKQRLILFNGKKKIEILVGKLHISKAQFSSLTVGIQGMLKHYL